ncbi:MAG TPA: FAD:protein FMN transferase [Patescibacteria group bacterium]|nr:FAD:protein FMN transferase [Patescibacteria group bacterium]
MLKTNNVLGLFLLLLFLMNTLGCSSTNLFSAKPYKETQFLMDTIIEITAYGPNAEPAVKAAFDEFKRIQIVSDRYNPDSQVSKINQMAGLAPVVVDPDIIKMVNDSIDVSQKTDGAFDISIGALTELWGVGHKGDYVPTPEEIQSILPLVDYRLIQVDPLARTIFLPKPGMRLDLGGVAKDYAMTKATHVLKQHGIKSALLNAGGDIQVIGTKPDTTAWRIGIQDPRNSDNIAAKISLRPWNTLQTSGDYQRFFIKDGTRYAHIIDPKTGKQPTEIASVTLVYQDTDQYDVASSGFLVLGLEKGMAALQNFPGVEAVFITTEGKIITSPGLQGTVELK